MKVVVQRVSRARVEAHGKVVGQIADGLLVLLGITHDDTEEQADWLVEKLTKLRIFEDEDPSSTSGQVGKMNLSVDDIGGGMLVVSQFTLYGDCKKGTRPSFVNASRPEHAEPLYNYFVQQCIDSGIHTETGEFGAKMEIDLENDGPVTLVLEK